MTTIDGSKSYEEVLAVLEGVELTLGSSAAIRTASEEIWRLEREKKAILDMWLQDKADGEIVA